MTEPQCDRNNWIYGCSNLIFKKKSVNAGTALTNKIFNFVARKVHTSPRRSWCIRNKWPFGAVFIVNGQRYRTVLRDFLFCMVLTGWLNVTHNQRYTRSQLNYKFYITHFISLLYYCLAIPFDFAVFFGGNTYLN